MANQNVDIENLSDEELIKRAAEEMQADEQTEEVEEQQAEPQVFRREIDLGDGSGKQVFEAETMEALVDKLAEAQRNATRKIRELSRESKVEKAVEKTVENERELTADEEWTLSQELLNHPSKTQKKIIEGMFGMPIDEVRDSLKAAKELRAQKAADAASEEFVAAHADEYYPCPENGRKLAAYLRTHGLAWNVENMEKAFTDLQESALLKSRPAETVEQDSAESDTAEHQDSSRIVKTETKPVTSARRAASGLTSRGRAAAAVRPKQLTEDELYAMPEDKLYELANRAARENSE